MDNVGSSNRMFLGRLTHKSDLLDALGEVCREQNVLCGSFCLIGSLIKTKLGFYNQTTHNYIESVIMDNTEIISCLGNVSLKNGEMVIHAHLTVADDQGETFGGHLLKGCEVFAAEYCLYNVSSQNLTREKDDATGLFLWP